MKFQEILFKKPIRIIQVFRNINIYGKQDKSFETRKDKISWKQIQSNSGYIFENELYLPEQILMNPDFKDCDLITIEDDNQDQVASSKYKSILNHCFITTRTTLLDIFEIRMKEEVELHLKYGYFEVGTPKRENFKLCDIKINVPVEIKINGKTDSSLSSRRDRVFKEQLYIFNYLGDFQNCKILKEPHDFKIKYVPEDRKVIDLIKQLW